MTKEKLLDWLKENNHIKFRSYAIQSLLKFELGTPKAVTKINIQKLLKSGLIEKVSESGYCKTLCASCYEYGCDDGVTRPPINYFRVTC